MTAELLAFRQPPATGDTQALLEAAVELHALISIDPVMGASPARVYFVFNPEAKRRISVAVDGGRTRPSTAYAVVAYDFAFALHLVEIAGRPTTRERAKAIADLSAGLQGEVFQAAADRLGVEALPILVFDAEALKGAFFPHTQESVICLFRLELQTAVRQAPGSAQS